MCVIIYTKIGNSNILAKNRDRKYKPKISIVHEIINGIEVAYIRDHITEWIEGISENGYSILNTALATSYDENPNTNLDSKNKYLKALSTKSYDNFLDNLFHKKYYSDIALQGHNFASNAKLCIHLESFKDSKPIVNILSNDFVCTNHVLNLPDGGYLSGLPLASSIIRKKIIDAELEKTKITNYDDIFNLLNKNYTELDIGIQPYRNTNNRHLITTGQLLLDSTNKKLIYNYDTNNSEFIGITNNLPINYKPKIEIIVNPTSKSKADDKLPFDKKEIDDILNKYK
jgi:hypothetical protein